MKCCFTTLVVVLIMATNWSIIFAVNCRSSFDCPSPFKNCCSSDCSYRRYCSGLCSNENDCAASEYCVRNKCNVNLPLNYCDLNMPCSGKNLRCKNYVCTPYCDCAGNERCNNGKCEEKDSSGHSFTPASVIGFTAVVVIGSCIACTLYCGCARRGRQQRAQQQQQQRYQQQEQQPREEDAENATPSNDPTGGPQSPPIHPGGPPPYHSLEMLDRLKNEPPPPSYEEALRNSQNTLNV